METKTVVGQKFPNDLLKWNRKIEFDSKYDNIFYWDFYSFMKILNFKSIDEVKESIYAEISNEEDFEKRFANSYGHRWLNYQARLEYFQLKKRKILKIYNLPWLMLQRSTFIKEYFKNIVKECIADYIMNYDGNFIQLELDMDIYKDYLKEKYKIVGINNVSQELIDYVDRRLKVKGIEQSYSFNPHLSQLLEIDTLAKLYYELEDTDFIKDNLSMDDFISFLKINKPFPKEKLKRGIKNDLFILLRFIKENILERHHSTDEAEMWLKQIISFNKRFNSQSEKLYDRISKRVPKKGSDSTEALSSEILPLLNIFSI